MAVLTPEQVLAALTRRWTNSQALAGKLKAETSQVLRILKKLQEQSLVESQKVKGRLEWRLASGEAQRLRRIKTESKAFEEEQKTPDNVKEDLHKIGSDLYQLLAKGEFPQIQLPSRSITNIQFDRQVGQYVLAGKTVARSSRNVGQIRSFSQLIWVMRFINELLGASKSSTLRDIYYSSEAFGVKFANQSESDEAITDVEAKLRAPREVFRVFPEERAAIYGDLTVEYVAPPKYAGRQVNLLGNPDGFMIGPYLSSAKFIDCKADKVIAIECLDPSTLVQQADGNIARIDSLAPTAVVAADLTHQRVVSAEAAAVIRRPATADDPVCLIRTGGMSLEATRRHLLFILTEDGICCKRVGELKVGDWIAEARRIRVHTAPQTVPSLDAVHQCRITRAGQEFLAATRQARGLSQRALAERTGTSQTTVGRIEKGTQEPKREILEAILSTLNLGPEQFFQQYVNRCSPRSKLVRLPQTVTPALGQMLGYLLGDGNIVCSSHHYWTALTDSNREILEYYRGLGKQVFGLEGEIRASGRQRLFFCSAPLARCLQENLSELFLRSPARDISPCILRSPLTVTAKFLRGLYDAEGYIGPHDVVLRMGSSSVVQKTQMLLLRHEIKAHVTKAATSKTENFRYSLQITERDSLHRFRESIGFSHPEKQQRLDNMITALQGKKQRPNRPPFPPVVRRVIRRKFRERGLRIPSKFYGEDRGVSMQLLEEAIFILGRDSDLEKLRDSDLMWSKVRELTISENQPSEVWDITVPGPASFVANGIITHNCGGMFTRFVEDGVNETHNAILIHTGGQAPRSARRIIRRLRYELNLPTYLFVDGDPWGCHISQVIISGSAQAAHLRGLATPDAIWLGVWASDIQKYHLPSDALTDTDRKRTQELLRDPRYQSQFWQKELKLFLEHGRKAEQQAFSRFGLSYVTKEYLPAKFAEIQKLKKQGIL